MFNFGDLTGGAARSIKNAAGSISNAANEARTALQQSEELISNVSRTTEDMSIYVKRIQGLPIEDLIRRFDYRSNVVTEQLVEISTFMKRTVIISAVILLLAGYIYFVSKD